MTAPTARRVTQARVAVFVLFAGLGFMMGSLLSRIPTVRDLLHVTPGGLATLMVIGFTGGLVSAMLIGAAVARFGMSTMLFVTSASFMVAMVLIGYATAEGSRVMYAAALWVTTFSWAFIDAGANVEAANVERRLGKSVMAQFHAAFSLGMLAAVGAGYAVSSAEIAPVWHYGVVAVVVGVSFLVVARAAVLDAARREDVSHNPFAHAREAFTDRRTLAIGMVLFCAFLAEMAATDWVPLSVVDAFDQPEKVGIALFSAFVVAMVAVRVVGHRFLDRFGRTAVVRASAAAIALGAVVFAVAPSLWALPVGLAIWGAGAALGYPTAMSAAADDPLKAAGRVGAVAAFGTIAGLTMPQLIGHLGEAIGLRPALLVVVAGAAVMIALARFLAPLGPEPAESSH